MAERKALNKSSEYKFPLVGLKDSLENMFLLDGKLLSVALISEKIGSNGFQLPEIYFILAGIRFCINNLFVQDTVTVVTHKRRQFLKKISTSRKICFINSNKAFLLKLFFTRKNNCLYFQNEMKVKNYGFLFMDNWFTSRRLF